MSKKDAAKPQTGATWIDPSTSRPPAVFHVDLDGVTEVAEAWDWPVPEGPDVIYESGFRAALELFERNGIKATLFTVARSLDDPRKRALIEEAVSAGHEIASHTVSHPNIRTLTRAQKVVEVGESRRLLTEQLGVDVKGFRAPGYRLDREALEVLVETGYSWDASGFPTESFAAHWEVPIETLTRPAARLDGLALTELPLPDHRPSPVPFNPSYAILMGMPYFRWGVRRVARRGLPLVLLFHLIDFAQPLPRDALPGLKARVFTLSTHRQATKLRRCQAVVDEIRARFDLIDTTELLTRIA